MKRQVIMKTSMLLMSIIFMLLALPAKAKIVKVAVVSEAIVENLKTVDDLNTVIETNARDLDAFFVNDKLNLREDQTLLILGGRDSIVEELTKYPQYLVTTVIPSSPPLGLYACYRKWHGYTTHVMIQSVSFKWNYCAARKFKERAIDLQKVIDVVKTLH